MLLNASTERFVAAEVLDKISENALAIEKKLEKKTLQRLIVLTGNPVSSRQNTKAFIH
jgi:hypothetical protein